MMDLNRTVNVKNRGTGGAGYTLPDSGVRRTWAPGEIKKSITVSELEQATYVPGGLKLIQKYLVINDPEVCEYLGIETEPEYFYDETEIRTLLTTGTIEQLLDCLDFAPTGVLDLIKKISLEIKLNDVAKRDAIKNKMGFDVTAAIANTEYANSKEIEASDSNAKTRRANPIGEATSTTEAGRRSAPVQAQKYQRVNK